MAKNRSIESKIRKMKRRNRHAVFAGESSKYAVRIDRGRYQDVTEVGNGADKDLIPSGKHVVIPVGPISLSKAVISTGRGPEPIRMQEYYQRLHSYDEALPKTLGFVGYDCTKGNSALLKYQEILRGVPRDHCINFVNDAMARLDLFFSGQQWFWVEVNHKEKYWRRSTIYVSKKMAITFMECDKITWVEKI